MFIKDQCFRVVFSDFAERHFCKSFLKKYKRQWIETEKTIRVTLEHAHQFEQTSLIDNLKFSQNDGVGIFKLDFRVAGTNESPKTSGNRVIFFVCNNTSKIEILLVYGKDHCQKNKSETQWILEQIKQNFSEYKDYAS
ncbi:MAG: hypothetical protein K9L85_02765 [Candidatus Peribacteraceae bacterium]|nr:hypothetical protein [Candidatus Peribacteraceae bacterium]